MSETPTDFVARCRAYAEKATKGPWYFADPEFDNEPLQLCADTELEEGITGPSAVLGHPSMFADAEIHANWDFIKASRNDLPAALSIIETLVAERDVLLAMVKKLDAEVSDAYFEGVRVERECVAAMKGSVPSE